MNLDPTFDPGQVFQDRPLLDYISRLILCWIRAFGVPERDCEDVQQNVLFALHRGLPSFDPRRSFWPWLKTIVYRITRDHLELACHRREHLEGGAGDHADAEGLDAEELLLFAEARRTVWGVLATLEAPRRAVLVLHDHDGLPMAEIAAAQGIPVNTGYTRLRHAREDFRLSWRRRAARRRG